MKAKISIDGLQQGTEFDRFVGNLIFGTKNMRIILGKGAYPHNPMQCAGWFIPVTGSKFGHPQWQITIGLNALSENLHMTGAIHRFERQCPFIFGLRGKHILAKFFPMS